MRRLWLGLAVAVTLIGCRDKKAEPVPDTDGGEGIRIIEEGELTAEDTIITAADSAARRRMRGPRAAVPPGIAFGLNKMPADMWCSSGLTATVAYFAPKVAAGVVRKAEYCDIRIIPAMPRAQMTHNQQADGYFSLVIAKRGCKNLSEALGNLKSSGNIAYMMIGDELHSTTWAGRIANNREVSEYVRYCSELLRPIKMMLRTPASTNWAQALGADGWPGLTYFAATYKKGRGPKKLDGRWPEQQKAYYDGEVNAANRLNKKVALLVNFANCSSTDREEYCSPSEVREFSDVIYNHPSRNCATSWWTYEDRAWNNDQQRNALKAAAVEGRGRSGSC